MGRRKSPTVNATPNTTMAMRSAFSLTWCKAQAPARPPTMALLPSTMACSQCTSGDSTNKATAEAFMDRYESLMDYAAAKHRIFMNQTARDVAILNADDELVSS